MLLSVSTTFGVKGRVTHTLISCPVLPLYTQTQKHTPLHVNTRSPITANKIQVSNLKTATLLESFTENTNKQSFAESRCRS